MYPEELRYHEGHAWVRQDGDELTIGLTQYAVDEMGEIIFVELPEEGTEIERDEPYGSVESAKAVEDLVAPVSGEVIRRNESVLDAPEAINDDCYGEGWLIAIQSSEEGLDNLLTANEYRSHIDEDEADEEIEDEETDEEELPSFEEDEQE